MYIIALFAKNALQFFFNTKNAFIFGFTYMYARIYKIEIQL